MQPCYFQPCGAPVACFQGPSGWLWCRAKRPPAADSQQAAGTPPLPPFVYSPPPAVTGRLVPHPSYLCRPPPPRLTPPPARLVMPLPPARPREPARPPCACEAQLQRLQGDLCSLQGQLQAMRVSRGPALPAAPAAVPPAPLHITVRTGVGPRTTRSKKARSHDTDTQSTPPPNQPPASGDTGIPRYCYCTQDDSKVVFRPKAKSTPCKADGTSQPAQVNVPPPTPCKADGSSQPAQVNVPPPTPCNADGSSQPAQVNVPPPAPQQSKSNENASDHLKNDETVTTNAPTQTGHLQEQESKRNRQSTLAECKEQEPGNRHSLKDKKKILLVNKLLELIGIAFSQDDGQLPEKERKEGIVEGGEEKVENECFVTEVSPCFVATEEHPKKETEQLAKDGITQPEHVHAIEDRLFRVEEQITFMGLPAQCERQLVMENQQVIITGTAKENKCKMITEILGNLLTDALEHWSE